MTGVAELGPFMRADDFFRLRKACAALSGGLSRRQLMTLAESLMEEARSRSPQEADAPEAAPHFDLRA